MTAQLVLGAVEQPRTMNLGGLASVPREDAQVVIIGPNGTATDGVYLSCDAGERFVRVEDVKTSPS